MSIKWFFILPGLILIFTSTEQDSFKLQLLVFIFGLILIFFPLFNKLFINKYLKPLLIQIYKLIFFFIIKPLKVVIILCLIIFAIFFLFNKVSAIIWEKNHQIKGWVFAGYDYRWSTNYVENKGLKSELECVSYGDNWIKKQQSEEAIYTCSSGCRDAKDFPGMLVCKKICEYKKTGLIRCRD